MAIVSTTLGGAWSVHNLAASSQAGSWSVRNSVTTSQMGAWSVQNLVSALQDGAWSVRNMASTYLEGAWQVGYTSVLGSLHDVFAIPEERNVTFPPTLVWVKRPGAVLTIGLWWQNIINRGETLADVLWNFPPGLTKVAESINNDAVVDMGVTYPVGQVAQVRIAGGTSGTDYPITCRVTTGNGNIDERDVIVSVRK